MIVGNKLKSKLQGYVGAQKIRTRKIRDHDKLLEFARRVFKIPPELKTFDTALAYVEALSQGERRRLGNKFRGLKDPGGFPVKISESLAPDSCGEFYSSWEWKELRYQFLKDKKRRCQCCGAAPENGIRIVVDHIKPIRRYWNLRLDIRNLQCLCNDCNMGKGSRDETDWRARD